MSKREPNPLPTLWTTEECATYLSITPDALRVARQRGTSPPYVKIGTQVRYAPGEVVAWLKARRA